ncbi:thiamine phosphate synthase [Gilvimarinus xylanilyticus]|uniref:Thiamine-phosphate synthase n=1 Tax=Gilvimarinus xylanilyticus TaxID=2944139 RepID=A0A9X2KWY1_9GAMM|nr:thiamine phosphate synthase [Gilvimarinus xylanilyticus]MCP8899760.1 thiamine phosphate synthase [Gilvimarinus xylanilyticus]
MLKRPPHNHLYAITECQELSEPTLLSVSESILAGGCQLLQYRDKSDDSPKRQAQASHLQTLCRAVGAQLIINDDIALACEVGAAGVHLGQSDASPAQAREMLGPDAIIGVTCHDDLNLAQEALTQGANYIAFGRFYASSTKPGAPPAPLKLLQEARSRWPQAVIVAIGGLNLDNAPEVISQGADYTAMCHSVYHHPQPQQYAEQFDHRYFHSPDARSVS